MFIGQLCLLEIFKFSVSLCAWARTQMFEMFPAQDNSDVRDVSSAGYRSKHLTGWTLLWTEEKKHKRGQINSASLRMAYWTHPCSFCTSLCETYMTRFLLKFFRSILNLLAAELPDSRGICAVGEPNCVTEKWWLNFYLISQDARPAARHLACTVWYFRRVPTHMQPKSMSCSSPLACSSRLALDLCTAVLPSTASLPMPRFGWNQQTLTEHCRTRQAPSERQLRMSGCLWCLFGWMCSLSVKNRLKQTIN